MADQNQNLQNLMAELGLTDLPQDKQDEMAIKMTEVILKRMFVETMDNLKPAEQDAYGEMLDKGASPEEIEQFLKSKIDNYDRVLEKIVADFRAEMLKDTVGKE